jgi:hypothetical protein
MENPGYGLQKINHDIESKIAMQEYIQDVKSLDKIHFRFKEELAKHPVVDQDYLNDRYK